MYHVAITKINVFGKFHEDVMIFDEIREYLAILQFYRAQTYASVYPYWKTSRKFELEVAEMPNVHRICVM